MNKIVGKVVVKETGAGVPDLVVIAYDVDRNRVVVATAVPGNAPPIPPAGDRLGSVLTDADGRFELTYSDTTTPGGGRERLADLMIVVMAPEDSGSGAYPVPLPPSHRMLHHMVFPRAQAGQTESFVIRLPAAQLDRLNIRPSPSKRPLALPDEVLGHLDVLFALTDGALTRIGPRAGRTLAKAKEAAERADRAFARFRPSLLPAAVRALPIYHTPEKNLFDCQRQVARGNIARALSEQTMVQLRLRSADVDLSRLDVRLGPDRRTVSLLKLLRYFRERQKELVLYRRSTSLLVAAERDEADRIMEDILGKRPPRPDAMAAPVPPDGGPYTAEMLVADMVRRHMQQSPAPDEPRPVEEARRASHQRINESTQAFELRGGPADATAYHDFHQLRIAFDHVRTEILDRRPQEEGRKTLYSLIRQKQALGIDQGEETSIETLDQWRRFLDVARLEDRLLHEERERPVAMFRCARDNHDCLLEAAKRQAEAREAADGAEPPSPQAGMVLGHLAPVYTPYKFDVFAPDSVNYGLLVTYRQQWRPLNFQVGELVSTVPLAPKETHRYAVKKVIKKSRSRKESEAAVRIRKEDSEHTKRADGEIVERAGQKTNFRLAAEGGGTIGVVHANASTGLETEAETSSASTKKDFREAVMKAAEEYKQERHLEMETAESKELEETASGEITNPNDELTVTYLFYELQRRYEISEQIHRLMPVVLVANEVPNPADINEDWLIRHDWILRRALLDDAFAPALASLTRRRAAERSLEVLRSSRDAQKAVVDELRLEVTSARNKMDEALLAWQRAMAVQAGVQAAEDSEGFFESVAEGLFGGDQSSPEAAKIRTEKARTAFELVQSQVEELQSRLGAGVGALEAATEKYAQAKIEYEVLVKDIARLGEHVAQNILYYMQAIWDHEPPDQRFFRLYNKPALWMEAPVEDYRVDIREGEDGEVVFEVAVPAQVEERDVLLEQIADLDSLVGYKGNYMIFPLRRHHLFTWYMSLPYVDFAMGLRDPDAFANYTTEELIESFKRRYRKNPGSVTEQEISEWHRRILERLTSARREKDIVVVPTSALYIEALPGTNPLLEDFKLDHRELDVKKVLAEVRRAELENVRLGARLLSAERDDPDIDKRIVIEGNAPSVIVPPEP